VSPGIPALLAVRLPSDLPTFTVPIEIEPQTRQNGRRNMRSPFFSRREILLLAGTAACAGAADKDFWNSKPPSEWDAGEIYSLMNSSPWAKTVSWQGPPTPTHNGLARSGKIGGLPEVGPKAVVPWESAPPVRDAMKTPSAPVYANFYVIGVDAIPDADSYDLKKYAHLHCAGKSKWSVSAFGAHTLVRTSLVYEFSFPRAAAPIGPDTGEVIFEIDLGEWLVQSKFKTQDMLYRGRLAL
jgi:hypothetical protein